MKQTNKLKTLFEEEECYRIKQILVTFFVMIPIFLLSVHAFAQSIVVKGRVLNEKGEPVNAASVVVKGSKLGTTTNNNGDFEIAADANATLVISAVDFQTMELKVNNQTTISVSLQHLDKVLGEVVVTGYGTQRKKDITGAVSSIKGDALREVPQPNVIGQLQGRLAGVDVVRNNSRPGTSGQIRIRGNRTMVPNNTSSPAVDDAFNAPLIVLDGIPYGGSINDLNPDDITSVDILKDASATAIYGSRGSNGVILVTTKRGRTGKAVVSLNTYYGLGNVADQYKVFNGPEYAAFKQQAKDYNNGVSNYPLTTAEQTGLANGTSTDWQDLVYQQSYVTNNELSVSGGSEGSQYSLGGGYYKETAVVPGQSFERFSLRTTIDSKIGSRIKVGVNSMNSLSYTNGAGLNPINALVSLSPLLAPYNADGSLNLYPAVGTSDPTKVNPLTIKNEEAIVNRTRRIRTFNSLYGEVQIIKNLKYRINIGLDFRQDQGDNYLGPNTLYNAGTSAPPTPGTTSASSMTVTNAEAWTYVIENLLNYEKTFATKHRVAFTGLFSTQKDHSQSSGFTAQGIPADYIQDYNLNLAFGNLAAQNGSFVESGLLSYMGRVNYSYDNRYSLTATVRRDGSSRLSEGHKWFTYPAFGVAWNISNESFMNGISFVNNLKLRAGWGITASQGIQPYQTLGTLATNFYNYGTQNATGYYVNFLANKNLQWQSTSNWNVGLDFSVLKNRISGSIEVYSQKTDDILLNQSLPPSNGAGATIINLGKSKGHGVEISLNTINIQSKSGFSWTTDISFFMNREEIVELNSPGLKADIGNGWFVGQPFTVIYDVKNIGIWQTKDASVATTYGQKPGQIRVADINNDGKINGDDRQILGNFQPDYISGMTNRFAYKEFDLSIVTFARMGQMVVVPYLTSDGGANGYDFFGNGRINSFKRDYWTSSNPTDKFPSPDASQDGMLYGSTLGYRDGSFIKCRSINVGYTVPASILNKTGLSSIRIYVTAQNPFIIYSPLYKSGLVLDPEGNGYSANGGGQGSVTSSAGGTPVPFRAITVGLNTPPSRQFIFGLNLKF